MSIIRFCQNDLGKGAAVLKKQIVLLLTVLVLLQSVCVSASATAVPDLTVDGSIRVTMRAGGKVIPGGSMTCYRVGDVRMRNGSLGFVLSGSFAAAGVSLDDLDSPVLASRLAAYAARRGITGTTKTIGRDGTVVFRDLKPGLYLIVQREAAPGYYAAAPFLVTLPMQVNGSYRYDVDASPKAEAGTKDDTWTPEDETPKKDDQKQPEDSKKPEDSRKPENDQPKLPQTGQLNWPVPVLAAAGLFLLLLGRILRGGKRERHES